jgi:hypothetical protein
MFSVAEAVVAERLQWERQERRFLLGKHRRHLALGRAVDAGVRPALLPAVQVCLCCFQAFKAQSPERSALSVPDARLDLTLAVRIPYPTGQRHGPVVSQQVSIEWVQRGIVDVRCDDAFAQVIEDDHADRAAQTPEGTLVKLGPDSRRRFPDEQTD